MRRSFCVIATIHDQGFCMSDTAVTIHERPPADWNQFVEKHPLAKIYHLTSWNEMVTRTFGHPVHYVTLRRDQQLVGLLPLTIIKSRLFSRNCAVSQPFINYGGPLLSDPDADMPVLTAFLQQLVAEKGYDFVELRMENQLKTGLQAKTHKVTFFLDLPEDIDAVMASLKAKVRSQVRRPIKDKMFGASGGLNLLDQYYDIFARNMRDLGTPVLPKAFFRNILETFPEQAYIVVIYTDQKVAVAASFLIKFRDVMEIPWASALREYNRSSPNMLLYHDSFAKAIECGCKVFDFGRCSKEGGTYKFKKQWGSREHQLYWYYALPDGEEIPEINPENAKYDLAIRMWQKLPVGITRILGPPIIKNIP